MFYQLFTAPPSYRFLLHVNFHPFWCGTAEVQVQGLPGDCGTLQCRALYRTEALHSKPSAGWIAAFAQ